MPDIYLSTLTTDGLRDRIAMAREWIDRGGHDGHGPDVSVAYWERQHNAAKAELRRILKGATK